MATLEYNDTVISPDGARAVRFRKGTDTQFWFSWENIKKLFDIQPYLPLKSDTEIELKRMEAIYRDDAGNIYVAEKGIVPILHENRINMKQEYIEWLCYKVFVTITRRLAPTLGLRKEPKDGLH